MIVTKPLAWGIVKKLSVLQVELSKYAKKDDTEGILDTFTKIESILRPYLISVPTEYLVDPENVPNWSAENSISENLTADGFYAVLAHVQPRANQIALKTSDSAKN